MTRGGGWRSWPPAPHGGQAARAGRGGGSRAPGGASEAVPSRGRASPSRREGCPSGHEERPEWTSLGAQVWTPLSVRVRPSGQGSAAARSSGRGQGCRSGSAHRAGRAHGTQLPDHPSSAPPGQAPCPGPPNGEPAITYTGAGTNRAQMPAHSRTRLDPVGHTTRPLTLIAAGQRPYCADGGW
jgi:hypothetical protein